MNPEKSPEMGGITASQEMDTALTSAKKEEWGEVLDCLNQFDVKGSQGGLTEETKEQARQQLSEIKQLVEESSDSDEQRQIMIQRALETAEKRIAE